MNLAARYKVWGEQGNISLRVSDPFKLQKFGYRTANGTVIEYSERFFGSRAVLPHDHPELRAGAQAAAQAAGSRRTGADGSPSGTLRSVERGAA